jgi:hypothetical protein
MPSSPKAKKTKRSDSAKTKAKLRLDARASLNTANPTYADVVALLNILVPLTDEDIGNAPHDAFWRIPPIITRDQFVAFDVVQWANGATWSGGPIAGPLVTPGNADTSWFYLALAGKPPFDGNNSLSIQRMPDITKDSNATLATPDDLALVAIWIKNGAPA